MNQGAYEVALEETDVGLHTFEVRAIDFEGNVGVPSTAASWILDRGETSSPPATLRGG